MKIFKVIYIKEETSQSPMMFETWVFGNKDDAEKRKQTLVDNIIEDYGAVIMDEGRASDSLITLAAHNKVREYFTVALDDDTLL